MKLNSVVLVLMFLIRLKKKSFRNVSDYILSSYGEDVQKLYRKYYNISRKCLKVDLDLDFLKKCKIYNIFPKFLRFKLYKKCLQSSKFYKSWQTKLLLKEIQFKNNSRKLIGTQLSDVRDSLRQQLSLLDFAIVNNHIHSELQIFEQTTKATHSSKLLKLGIVNNIEPCNPDDVIYNFSSVTLSSRLKILLSFGLEICLPVYKLDFYKYFVAFEKLALTIKTCAGEKYPDLMEQIRAVSKKYFYNFKSYKVFSAIFNKQDLSILKDFSRNSDIIVTKPDKGKGVVIINKTDYINSMNTIVSDKTKFEEIKTPMKTFALKMEDKVNNILRKLKSLKLMSEDTYKALYASGTAPGILYGLPKIHKKDFGSKFQFRPIFAAYNTPSFKLAKFLVPILNPFTNSANTVSNSFCFAKDIIEIDNANNFVMASFDIESLFTNIPLSETIDICLERLFTTPTTTVIGLSKALFRKTLEIAVMNSFFIFNNKLFAQREGLGMGLPLGPTFANIFMCFHETVWLNDCPLEFKPALYKRYVDDTFLLFNDASHIQPFLDYLNSRHPNIKFTKEIESDNCLSFLDVKVSRKDSKFHTSVYRKPTFSGLGLSFFSFCSLRFKINAVKTLVFRAYNICSGYVCLHKEFEFLCEFFCNNGYPKFLVHKVISNFLNSRYEQSVMKTESCESVYLSLPYFGQQSEKLKSELCKILKKYIPNKHFNIILVNKSRLGNFFRFKDALPMCMRSNLVYHFSCASSCEASERGYVGSTIRTLGNRIADHMGVSYRTSLRLAHPPHSSIRLHCEECNVPVKPDNFKILAQCSSEIELRLLESMYIFKLKPPINDTASAFPLQIVNS